MIGLLQRVSRASVVVDGRTVAECGAGLLVFVGIERTDTQVDVDRLLYRLLRFRVFADDGGRMNLSLQDLGPNNGSLLLVPQFTLAAKTGAGHRAGFSSAAPPEVAQELYSGLVDKARIAWPSTSSGIFGADMEVSLVNSGPVTFLIRS